MDKNGKFGYLASQTNMLALNRDVEAVPVKENGKLADENKISD